MRLSAALFPAFFEDPPRSLDAERRRLPARLCKTSDTLLGMNPKINPVRDLGEWVRDALGAGRPDSEIARVVIHEIDQWDRNPIPLDDPGAIAGSARWDALIEGLAARHFHSRGDLAPAWTERTRLDEAWGPYADAVTNEWHLINVMLTPVELLDRGVILSRTELVLI